MTDADYIIIKYALQQLDDLARRYLPDSGKVVREAGDRARAALERTKNKQENSLTPQQASMF